MPASLLLSGHFYDETVRHGHLGLFPEDFRKVGFTVKEHTADAWLQLPGRQPPAEAAPEPAEAQEEPACSETAGSKTAGSKMVNKASGHGVVYATQHGTQHIRIERKH